MKFVLGRDLGTGLRRGEDPLQGLENLAVEDEKCLGRLSRGLWKVGIEWPELTSETGDSIKEGEEDTEDNESDFGELTSTLSSSPFFFSSSA